MTRRKFRTPEDVEREKDAVMFGKICGCGECQYCIAFEQEKLWERMKKMIEEERKRPDKWEDFK